MRTIKFRGYDCIGKKGWVYGDLFHNQKVTETGLQPRVMVGGYEVDPETVRQFTGLYDAHGEEIYEGDVLHDTETGETFKVVWYEDLAMFRLNGINVSAISGMYLAYRCEDLGPFRDWAHISAREIGALPND